MPSVNKVFLIGNLGKDPEVKYTPSGVQIAKFSMATSERVKRGDNWEEKLTGLGRTGRNFGLDHWSVSPDLLVCAKGLASGYSPLF
ncbi:MAG: single-stranded DNA-binding protein, partial [Candidatus Delongbacteria bacterium]